jgi:hypothetical protein
MNFFKRFITYVSLLAFAQFIGSPFLHATWEDNWFIVSLGSTVGNCTTSNYHCEKIDDVNYVCERNSELSSNHNIQFREIPTGQTQQASFIQNKCSDGSEISCPIELWKHYKSPDTYVYPFVSIIKIQV